MKEKLSYKNIFKTATARVIYGVIGLSFLAATLYIKGCFSSEATPSKQQEITTTNQVDSGSINTTNNQLTQDNKGAKEVKTEFITNKTENHYSSPTPNKPKIDTAIINNGGFVNQGGSGNTYNQTIVDKKPLIERHFTNEDLAIIKNLIPLNYEIHLSWGSSCDECETFAFEMQNILTNEGYVISERMRSMYVGISEKQNGVFKRVLVDVFKNNIAQISILPQVQ
jgi:hypothetical protein